MIERWNVREGRWLKPPLGGDMTRAFLQIAFSHDASLVAAADYTNSIEIWDTSSPSWAASC